MTREEIAAFLGALAECGNVSAASKAVKLSRAALYEHRQLDADFAKAWDEAVQIGAYGLEDEARRRAYEGTARPVYHGGVEVGAVREYSDTLMIFLLKGAMPDKYKDRVANEHSGDIGVRELSDTERAARIAAILDAARARGVGPAADGAAVDAAAGSADGGVPQFG